MNRKVQVESEQVPDISMITEANIRFYNQDAARREVKSYPSWKEEIREMVVDVARLRQLHTIIDVGCGTGQDAEFFAGCGFDVLGIDISPVAVEIARQRNVNAIEMDLHRMSLGNRTFDVVYSMNGLVHVPEYLLLKVLEDFSKLLTAKGIVFIGLYGGKSFQKFVAMESGLAGESTRASGRPLERFFSSYGFDYFKKQLEKVFRIVDCECIVFERQEFHWFIAEPNSRETND